MADTVYLSLLMRFRCRTPSMACRFPSFRRHSCPPILASSASTQTCEHNLIVRCQCIQYTQFLGSKHLGKQKPSQWYQSDNQHRETDCSDSLRDGDAGEHTECLPKDIQPNLRTSNGEKWSLGWMKRGSRTSHISLRRIGLDSTDPQPTTKKTPAKIDRGIVERTVRSGPVMVPMIARPITK